MAKSRTQGATGKGCGSYSVSHPDITHMNPGKGTKQSTPPIQGGYQDNSYSGPGMSEKLPKGKGK